MNYVKSLAKQLGPKGIRVNGVAPGPIWTALQVSGGATQEKIVKFGGDTPLERPGQPAELASIYVQLADNSGSYATWTDLWFFRGEGSAITGVRLRLRRRREAKAANEFSDSKSKVFNCASCLALALRLSPSP